MLTEMPFLTPELSVVVPMYNEGILLDTFFERVETVLNKLNIDYEIVCINDGSTDATLEKLFSHGQRNPAIKIVNLSRNFGKDIALSAGLDYCRGKAVIPIDADLQDPPELIGQLLAKWHEGYDVVYATRQTREGETWLKLMTAKLFYWVINHLSQTPIPANTGDFRLLDRRVVTILTQLPERTRFMKGLFAWVGFKQTSIVFNRAEAKRPTTWNYWKLWNFALDGITSFSSAPLRIWTYVGILIFLSSLGYAAFLIIRISLLGVDVPGYASTMVTLLLLNGIQFIALGLMGEYLARIHTEVKQRPLYLVRDVYDSKSHRTTEPNKMS